MLKTGTFYLLWFAFFCGCNAGLLLISNGTQIGVDIAKVSASLAATFVGILAVFNFIGRAAIGSLGDKIGRIRSLYGTVSYTHLSASSRRIICRRHR